MGDTCVCVINLRCRKRYESYFLKCTSPSNEWGSNKPTGNFNVRKCHLSVNWFCWSNFSIVAGFDISTKCVNIERVSWSCECNHFFHNEISYSLECSFQVHRLFAIVPIFGSKCTNKLRCLVNKLVRRKSIRKSLPNQFAQRCLWTGKLLSIQETKGQKRFSKVMKNGKAGPQFPWLANFSLAHWRFPSFFSNEFETRTALDTRVPCILYLRHEVPWNFCYTKIDQMEIRMLLSAQQSK